MPRPEDAVTSIHNGCNSAVLHMVLRMTCQNVKNRGVAFARPGIKVQDGFPLRYQPAKIDLLAGIFLCNLQFHHFIGIRHTAE